ncbi:EF hand [Maioricimonas rarisocia]|uniref:EF hand n=1 Tax=Maioricimonas rarisocia TaxID=2528026 RepID=A0A517Z9D4_9PLAN|nr:DUF1549 domain-containing protein [Maioricimonas rarisocia]QDU39094.1 EF hand [Maioricimonas rarisocia]
MMRHVHRFCWLGLMGLLLPPISQGAERIRSGDRSPSPASVSQQVDALILDTLEAESTQPAPLTSDEDFLRRVSLDLAGRIPSPREVTLFGLDPNPNKRAELIERLLESDEYASLWASYWSEVIFSRATDQRARLVERPFDEWMQEQLAANRPWDEIASELLTATGNVNENGRTALIFAHTGQPAELAAEVSRIFLGIQMQCANCHNHPTDSWTREQFHELAAYFPRIQVRRDPNGSQRDFVVSSFQGGNRRRQFNPEQIFRFADRNRDGMLTKAEVQRTPLGQRFDRLLEFGDKNKDGALSRDELKDLPQPANNQPGRGAAEYYMPDLENPAAQGTLMQPVLFVDGSRASRDADDLDRREALARSIASPRNEWFAKAFVNRIWAEMLGEGFFMPIDDLGPERAAEFPEVLDLLAKEFTRSGHDVKWLFRTIANTEAYQRELRTRNWADGSPAFASASPTRLRSDQIYSVLTDVLGVEQLAGARPNGRFAPGASPGDRARRAFAELFGFDPSTPQEDIIGNVPQALFLMNSPGLESLIDADRDTKLGRILRKYDDDQDAVTELYLLVLAREPSDRELTICREHIADVGNRSEAYEDLMWSLLNSSEFITKR